MMRKNYGRFMKTAKRSFGLMFLLFLAPMILPKDVLAQTKTPSGFYYPLASTWDHACGPWLGRDSAHGGCYFGGDYHIGEDMLGAQGSNVYAISEGDVVQIWTTNASDDYYIGPGNSVMFVKHTLSDGSQFLAEYMHVRPTVSQGSHVSAGQVIAKVGPWYNATHLHFGIHPSLTVPTNHWGIMQNASWPDTNGFVDPVDWIKTKVPYGSDPNADIGRGSSERQHFLDCFNRNGGRTPIGNPINDTHWWGTANPVVIQDFRGGSGGDGAIIDNEGVAHSTAFWVHGAIWAKYVGMGGPDSVLRRPLSDETPSANSPQGSTGVQTFFEGGSIYSGNRGTYEVHGAIYQTYAEAGKPWSGGTGGVLGFPTSDEMDAAGGGRLNRFEGGTIYFKDGIGAYPTYGVIGNKYEAAGGTGSNYGFPTSGPFDGPYGKQQNFEHGTLYENDDVTPPDIVRSGAAPGSYQTAQSVSWNVTDVGSAGLDEFCVSWWWDSGAKTSARATGNATMPNTEGSHTLHVTATDKAGNSRTSDFGAYILDTTAPNITFDAPATDTCLMPPQQVSWNGTDALGAVENVQYSWGGVTYVAAGITGTLVIPHGTQTLYVKANDTAGNQRVTTVGPFLVDATPPSAPLNLVASPGHYSAALAWSAPADDGCSAVAGYNVYARRSGAEKYERLNADPLNATTFNASGLTNGQHYDFAVTAVDGFGREGAKVEVPNILIGLRGDSSGDGVLDISDVLIAVNVIATPNNYTASQHAQADYDRDGDVDAADVTAMKNAILGK